MHYTQFLLAVVNSFNNSNVDEMKTKGVVKALPGCALFSVLYKLNKTFNVYPLYLESRAQAFCDLRHKGREFLFTCGSLAN